MYDATARRAVGGIKTLEKKITRGGGKRGATTPQPAIKPPSTSSIRLIFLRIFVGLREITDRCSFRGATLISSFADVFQNLGTFLGFRPFLFRFIVAEILQNQTFESNECLLLDSIACRKNFCNWDSSAVRFHRDFSKIKIFRIEPYFPFDIPLFRIYCRRNFAKSNFRVERMFIIRFDSLSQKFL